jgi:aminomethyltransferase
VTAALAKTPLHDWHSAHGGKLVDFAGWSMPVQYCSIVAEHTATRTAVGLFDVSHMGRLRFSGRNVAPFLEHVLTRRVTDMQPGQIRYSLVTNERGGILDDVLVYHGPLDGPEDFGMVVNASNRQKIVNWLGQRLQLWQNAHAGDKISIGDDTLRTAMIAVQGPKALQILDPLFKLPGNGKAGQLGAMRYYHFGRANFGDRVVTMSRTGYTGEHGFEIICDAGQAPAIWDRLAESAAAVGGMAAGLGARDTLRLEAAMPLYGHELTEEITPIEAGLAFAVNLEDRDFPGSQTLAAIKRDGPKRVRVGLELAGRRVPREHYGIYSGRQTIGEVTSGTFSPTLSKPIAMGYVPDQFSEPGTELLIDIRGTKEPARVVKLPFYRRAG